MENFLDLRIWFALSFFASIELLSGPISSSRVIVSGGELPATTMLSRRCCQSGFEASINAD
jgi:hypothetical protein